MKSKHGYYIAYCVFILYYIQYDDIITLIHDTTDIIVYSCSMLLPLIDDDQSTPSYSTAVESID
jgi:hypothetical protein